MAESTEDPSLTYATASLLYTLYARATHIYPYSQNIYSLSLLQHK